MSLIIPIVYFVIGCISVFIVPTLMYFSEKEEGPYRDYLADFLTSTDSDYDEVSSFPIFCLFLWPVVFLIYIPYTICTALKSFFNFLVIKIRGVHKAEEIWND